MFRRRPGFAGDRPDPAGGPGPWPPRPPSWRRAARPAAAAGGSPGQRPRSGRLAGRRPRRQLAGRHRGRPRGDAADPDAVPGGGRSAGALAPGRCAAIFITDVRGEERLPGTGELHTRVVEAFLLLGRTCAAELDLSLIEAAAVALGPVEAPAISPYLVATQDVALVGAAWVPAAEVEAALSADAADTDGSRPARGRQAVRRVHRGGQQVASVQASVPRA